MVVGDSKLADHKCVHTANRNRLPITIKQYLCTKKENLHEYRITTDTEEHYVFKANIVFTNVMVSRFIVCLFVSPQVM